jgi:asparagine synthase (glutamine-hydrolysing)
MTDAIAHRGPDAEGHYVDGPVGLGHRRLSIIDLSSSANQPLWDAEGRHVIVFNGEIYNFAEIRASLGDYPFRTKGDTEVILAAYLAWGPACLDRLYGMFAFAIWDTRRRQLFMARDRLGIKPFYYYQDGERFLFGSELRAILASGQVKPALDEEGLADYLRYQTVHAPRTLVRGIRQLLPGEYAVYGGGRLERKTWWRLAPAQTPEVAGDAAQVRKEVRELLFRAVERRLVSDVPLGAFLSGGIDSSAVVALMSEAAGRPVDTFSIVFEEPQFDESHYAGLVSRKFHTQHHPILLRPTDFLEALPDALRAMDTPSGDGVNTYVVSRVTRAAGITVALSGLGGDELFAGYPLFRHYLKMKRADWFWKIPHVLRTAGAQLAGAGLKSHQRGRVLEMAGAADADIAAVYPAMRKLLSHAEMRQVLPAAGRNGGIPDAVREQLLEDPYIRRLPDLSQLSVADISTYTQNVLLKDTDQMSMAHALEVRVPFFDHTLVEYVLGVPDRLKFPHYPKQLLVESLRPLIPDDVVFREKKGFDLPWKVWLKTSLRTFAETRLERLADRNIVDGDFLRGLWRTFLSGRNDNLWSRVWIFIVLEDWLERNIPAGILSADNH